MMRRLLIVVVVVLGLALVVDRGAVLILQRQLAQQVQRQEGLASSPTVKLRGFPFLTQVVRGRYDGGLIGLRGLHRDEVAVQRLTVDLHGIRLPLRTLLTGSVDAVAVDDVSGTARVAFPALAAATGIPGLTIRPVADRLELALPVSQFGQVVRLRVSARIAVTQRGLQITAGEAAGVAVPQSILNVALAQLGSALPLVHLPYGLRLRAVRVRSDGLELTAVARHIVLRRAGG